MIRESFGEAGFPAPVPAYEVSGAFAAFEKGVGNRF